MKIRYYIDADTGLPHIYSHAVEELEVEEVLSNRGRTGRAKMVPVSRLDAPLTDGI